MARKKNGKGKPKTPLTPSNPDIAYLAARIDARSEVTGNGLATLTVAVAETKAEISELTVAVAETKTELKAELSALSVAISTRLDKVIENTGGHWRELDARVRRLEQSSEAEPR